MRLLTLGVMLVGVSLATSARAADVHITLANGTVSVSATDATLGQILGEWARVGQTRIVNIERLPAAPISLQLDNVPEAQALDTVLRSASGYLAAPRAVPVPNASAYDRVFVLANSAGTPSRPASVASPPPAAVNFCSRTSCTSFPNASAAAPRTSRFSRPSRSGTTGACWYCSALSSGPNGSSASSTGCPSGLRHRPTLAVWRCCTITAARSAHSRGSAAPDGRSDRESLPAVPGPADPESSP